MDSLSRWVIYPAGNRYTGQMICGIDEVGRGPLAGPVTAAAVVLAEDFPIEVLADSKKLSPKQRRDGAALILDRALAYGLGWVWPEEIDRINIHHASLLAMKLAFGELQRHSPELGVTRVLVDGKFTPDRPIDDTEAIIKGDTKEPSIQAASIIAKEARDRWMIRYSWIEPGYGFAKHKGYPTAYHREQCARNGLCSIHRRSFRILPGERQSEPRACSRP